MKNYRKKTKNGFFNIIISMFVCVSTLILLVTAQIVDNDVQADNNRFILFESYVETTIPVISRGTSKIRDRETMNNKETKSNFYKEFIADVYPSVDWANIISPEEKLDIKNNNNPKEEKDSYSKDTDNEVKKENNIVVTAELPKKIEMDFSKPLVLIYHTHGTESYLPYDAGNYHSILEEGTVREVGEKITKALESKGIKVIHDKSLYDSPSYNQSYARSLDAAEKILAANKSIKIVIDLHRDAADYKKVKGSTVSLDGKDVANFSLVIGNKNENVGKLKVFSDYVNYKSDLMYPGLANGIIEKEYKFNQYLSDYYLLLEIGDNENHIDEAKNAGTYLGNIVYEVIKDIKIN